MKMMQLLKQEAEDPLLTAAAPGVWKHLSDDNLL
jgi:hypothetical protein